MQYPSGFTVEYGYTALGYQNQLKEAGTATVFWTANARDAELHLLQQTAGNGLVTTQGFNANTGLIATIQAGPSAGVANFAYSFDTLGNLTQRSDATQSLTEGFTYDSLNRLTTYTIAGQAAKTMTYDALGNITGKSDTGTYAYPSAGQARPHAVSSITGTYNATYSYDAVGNLTGDGTRTVTWTSSNMVATITRGANSVVFAYDTAHMRIRQEDSSGRTLYYGDPVSGLKIEKFIGSGGASQWNEYLMVGGEMVGEHFTKSASGGGGTTQETRYFVKDHLGSIAILTDESVAVVERLSYDAWGKRRHADGSDDPTGAITSQTTRGFTGHEMIDAVGLVNMNGRIYDPQIGRMLSADPFIPDALDTQSLNRFAYVSNNPLSLTDLTGYFSLSDWFGSHILGLIYQAKKAIYSKYPLVAQLDTLIAGIACTAATSGNVAAGAGCASAVSAIAAGVQGGSIQQVLIAGTTTFITAYATGGTVGYLGSIGASATAQFVGGVAAGALAGGVAESMQGGSFGHGAWLGAVSAAIGAVGGGKAEFGSADFYVNIAIRATLGGAVSVLGGGKFANGAITAAFSYVASSAAQGAFSKGRGSSTSGDDCIGCYKVAANGDFTPSSTLPPCQQAYLTCMANKSLWHRLLEDWTGQRAANDNFVQDEPTGLPPRSCMTAYNRCSAIDARVKAEPDQSRVGVIRFPDGTTVTWSGKGAPGQVSPAPPPKSPGDWPLF